MLTLTFKLLTGETIVEHISPDTTMRELMLAVADKFPPGSCDSNSFFWSFIKGGKWINTFANRHKPVSDKFKDGDVISCSMWILGGPSHYAHFKNNLLENQIDHEKECAVCFEELHFYGDDSTIGTKGSMRYSVSLNCAHLFHAKCISGLHNCPICKAGIAEDTVCAIRRYSSRNES